MKRLVVEQVWAVGELVATPVIVGVEEVDEYVEHETAPRPVGRCPRCGIAWYTKTGYCGGCET